MNKKIILSKKQMQFKKLFFWRQQIHKYPLGRWHNCGEYFNEKFIEIKLIQKHERDEMIKKNIDPYKKLSMSSPYLQ